MHTGGRMLRNETFEAELLEHPDDWPRWLVYADWWTERGDVRGEAVALCHRLQTGAVPEPERARHEDRYAALCRAIRWPEDAPWPPVAYRARFESLIRELERHPDVTLQQAELGPPTPPEELARWQRAAGPAWPDGMTELYRELGSVDLDYDIEGQHTGGIHLPPLREIWDHAALEDELWFDDLPMDHPLHAIRPVDRFVPEAYAVLSPVPPDREAPGPARIAFHALGEGVADATGLSYREWLELLLRARGALYWLLLTLGPPEPWMMDDIGRVAERFPDFAPDGMVP